MTVTLVVQGAAILLTALLSSVLTLALGAALWRRRYAARLERKLAEVLERLGETVEARVRQGVIDGIKSLPSPELVRWTRETVTEAASDLVRGGLSTLLGDKPKRPKDE